MIPHFNYYPPAGEVITLANPGVIWDGQRWMLGGRPYPMQAGERVIGRAGTSHDGWYYDWAQRAWIEPARPSPTIVQPTVTNVIPAPLPGGSIQMQKDPTVLEYLMKHPVAPLLGGFLMLGTQLAEEPAPPQIPADLPEPVAKQWQMIYAQNLQRFQRRMTLWENVGKLLLGYADTNAVLAALPVKR